MKIDVNRCNLRTMSANCCNTFPTATPTPAIYFPLFLFLPRFRFFFFLTSAVPKALLFAPSCVAMDMSGRCLTGGGSDSCIAPNLPLPTMPPAVAFRGGRAEGGEEAFWFLGFVSFSSLQRRRTAMLSAWACREVFAARAARRFHKEPTHRSRAL